MINMYSRVKRDHQRFELFITAVRYVHGEMLFFQGNKDEYDKEFKERMDYYQQKIDKEFPEIRD